MIGKMSNKIYIIIFYFCLGWAPLVVFSQDTPVFSLEKELQSFILIDSIELDQYVGIRLEVDNLYSNTYRTLLVRDTFLRELELNGYVDFKTTYLKHGFLLQDVSSVSCFFRGISGSSPKIPYYLKQLILGSEKVHQQVQNLPNSQYSERRSIEIPSVNGVKAYKYKCKKAYIFLIPGQVLHRCSDRKYHRMTKDMENVYFKIAIPVTWE